MKPANCCCKYFSGMCPPCRGAWEIRAAKQLDDFFRRVHALEARVAIKARLIAEEIKS